MPFKNSQDKKKYQRAWYAKNKKKEIKKIHARRRKIQVWFDDYKKTLSCSICGESHPATIDFHHKGNKEKGLADMAHWGYSIETIKKEISKCQVVCANCHRKIHWKDKNL